MNAAVNGKKARTIDELIEIPRINVQQLEVTLIGDSPLISHRWSEKAKQEMLDKQMKKAKTAKEAKDPWMDFCQSLYWISPMPATPTKEDVAKAVFGFPSVAFKAAAVTAAGDSDGMKMTESRRRFHVLGELATLEGSVPTMREDMVRIGQGTADIRYRGQFDPWRTTLQISYNASAISPAQIINLYNLAGFGVGIAEWRPTKDGQFGRFHVASEEELTK